MIGEGFGIPQGVDEWTDWTWFRASYSRSLLLAVLSEFPINYVGHYHKGQMRPCVGEGCELCADNVGKQLRYAFAAIELSTRRVGLMEVGRSVACQLQDWVEIRGAFRGMVLEVRRTHHSKHARLDVQWVEDRVVTWLDQVPSPNVVGALVATWSKAGFELPPGVDGASPKPKPRASEPKRAQEFIPPGRRKGNQEGNKEATG